jgi:outer membrane protein assembly factor BamD (BamD/ComL family)
VHHSKHFLSCICALLCSFAACAPVAEVAYRHPDKVLFDRAMDAVQANRREVARLTLETLVNTYPDSSYFSKAKRKLQELRTANCDHSSTIILSGCDSEPESMESD